MKKLIALLTVLTVINMFMTYKIGEQTSELSTKLEQQIQKTEHQPIKVTATMYNAVEAQCDSDPLITAGMYKINPDKASEHRWIAMSRDLLKRWKGDFDYGDKVLISGAENKDGVYTVVDTMNKRFTNRIDILETVGTPIYKYKNVTVIKLNS